jgi:hypothetical protein
MPENEKNEAERRLQQADLNLQRLQNRLELFRKVAEPGAADHVE